MNNEELKEQIEIYKNERDTYKRLAKSLIKQNNKLEDRNKEIYQGFIATVEEVCEANKKIDKAIEYIKKNINYYYDEDLEDSIYQDEISGNELLKILGGDE